MQQEFFGVKSLGFAAGLADGGVEMEMEWQRFFTWER